MSNFLGSIWWLIVAIGILVTFHEFGHFWVARRFGVHVIKFSVGFGKTLWSRKGRDGTEYVIAAIPLGGYVKMLDEREFEVDPRDAHQSFNRKPVLQRIAIVAAGPVFNFILCFVLLWLMFMVGSRDYMPVVGHAEGIAAHAGIEPGDRVLSVNGKDVPSWGHADLLLVGAAQDHQDVDLAIERADGTHASIVLPLRQMDASVTEMQIVRAIGLVPRQLELPAVIGKISEDGPKDLRAGDRILRVGSEAVSQFQQISTAIDSESRPGQPLLLTIQRDGQTLQVAVPLKMRDNGDGKPRLTIGIGPQAADAQFDTVRRYGPIDAIGVAAHEMWRLTTESLSVLRRIVSGRASLASNVHSPIVIAQYANATAQMGLAAFLSFLAILSLSLGIMNLLPIPVLDGGHLLYYLMELISGRPVSERVLVTGQYVGLALLAALMCFAFYNDLASIFPLSSR